MEGSFRGCRGISALLGIPMDCWGTAAYHGLHRNLCSDPGAPSSLALVPAGLSASLPYSHSSGIAEIPHPPLPPNLLWQRCCHHHGWTRFWPVLCPAWSWLALVSLDMGEASSCFSQKTSPKPPPLPKHCHEKKILIVHSLSMEQLCATQFFCLDM